MSRTGYLLSMATLVVAFVAWTALWHESIRENLLLSAASSGALILGGCALTLLRKREKAGEKRSR